MQEQAYQQTKRAHHGPNIADIMLNKRIDLLAEYERASLIDWYPPHQRALEERRAHLRQLCLRGLKRCYPAMTDAEREQLLATTLQFRDKPRTGAIGGGYIVTGSR